jgi:hypothetical protein
MEPAFSRLKSRLPGEIGMERGMQNVVIHAVQRRRAGYYEARARYARLPGNTPVIRLANAEMARGAHRVLDWFTRALADEVRARPKPENAYSLEREVEVSLVLPNLVSVLATDYHYTGGAHPNTNFAFYSFGLLNGRAKRLAITNFFRPGSNGPKRVGDAVYARLKKNRDAAWIQEGNIKPDDPMLTKPFVLTQTAFTFLFEPYAVGPYAAGMFSVKIPFAEFGEALNANGPLKPVLR